MSIKFSNTKGVNKYPKVLVFGESGTGKTELIGTAPKPIIISSENKLVTLSNKNIDVLGVKTIQDFEDALNLVVSSKYKKYKTPCIDSITDIATVAVHHEKKNHKDPRKAYGVVQDKILELMRQIRDSNDKKYWYIIAQSRMIINDESVEQYSPSMPGRQMAPALPFLFDYVFALRVMDESDEKKSYRYLQTDISYDTKYNVKGDRRKLKKIEKPDLTHIFNKLSK